jgi:purine-nucleoside phosphorylase
LRFFAAKKIRVHFRLRLLLQRGQPWLNLPVTTAVAKIKKLSRLRPTLALALGSGFQHVRRGLDVDAEIPYAKLPGFAKPTVTGHEGTLLIGRFGRTPVLVLSGRAHFYEGHSMDRVTFPIRVLAEYGIRDLLLTSAAGGINPRYRAGDFMRVTDHINFMGVNPLRPGGSAMGASQLPRFVDLTQVYDLRLNAFLGSAARAAKVKLWRGVYLAVSGPSYETPAEIRAFARLGADAVGMSTVPEAMVARQCGLRVAALSCLTNLAAGISQPPLSHGEVLKTAKKVEVSAAFLLENFVQSWAVAAPPKPDIAAARQQDFV